MCIQNVRPWLQSACQLLLATFLAAFIPLCLSSSPFVQKSLAASGSCTDPEDPCTGICCEGNCEDGDKCCGGNGCESGDACWGANGDKCCASGVTCDGGSKCCGSGESCSGDGTACCGSGKLGCSGKCCVRYCCLNPNTGKYEDCPKCNGPGNIPICYPCDHDPNKPGNDACYKCLFGGTPGFGPKTECYLCNNDGQNGNDDCKHTFDYTGASGYHVKCYDCDINGDGIMDSGIDEEINSYLDLTNCSGTLTQNPIPHVIDGCSSVFGDNPCNLAFSDFGACCGVHDVGYQTCGRPKSTSDTALLNCMLAKCGGSTQTCETGIYTCSYWAYAMYDALVPGGWPAWWQRQREYCVCCLAPSD